VPYKSGPEAVVGVLSNTVDFFAIVSYGSQRYVNNEKFKAILLMSNTPHKLFDVPLLPKKYKKLEQKKWTMLFGKNLSDKDKDIIRNTLKNLPDIFYTEDMGFWYTYKDPVKVFNDKP